MQNEVQNLDATNEQQPIDLSELTTGLGEIKDLLEDLQPTEEEILAEQKQKALEEEQTQKALEEQALLTVEQFETELETLNSINSNLLALETTISEQSLLIEEQTSKNFEGSFIVALALMITFAVYMFWNQLTKW